MPEKVQFLAPFLAFFSGTPTYTKKWQQISGRDQTLQEQTEAHIVGIVNRKLKYSSFNNTIYSKKLVAGNIAGHIASHIDKAKRLYRW